MALPSRPRPLRFFHRGEDGTHRDVRGTKARGFPGHGGKNSCGDRRYARCVLLQRSNAWTDGRCSVNARNAQPGRLRTWRLHHVFDRPVRLETLMEHFRHETDPINIDRYRCTNIPPCALELYNGKYTTPGTVSQSISIQFLGPAKLCVSLFRPSEALSIRSCSFSGDRLRLVSTTLVVGGRIRTMHCEVYLCHTHTIYRFTRSTSQLP